MARIDAEPEERDQEPLRLSAVFDCPACDTVFDHIFSAAEGVFEYEDLIEAPTETVKCPSCGYSWPEQWTGWIAHGDAG